MQKTSNKIEKYVIICDESSRKEKNYSYFYGGAMIKESKLQKLSKIITKF